jgi:hypothetical protein
MEREVFAHILFKELLNVAGDKKVAGDILHWDLDTFRG